MSRRVLHVIPAVAARYGGPSLVAVATVRELNARGMEALIATTDADGQGRLPVELARRTTHEHAPAIFFRRDFSEAFKWSRGLAGWLSAHVAEFDVVDVHALFSHSSLAASRAAARAGVPYVVRPHGALNPWGLAHKHWQKRALLVAGVRRMLTGAGAVVYTSHRERDLAERALPWLSNGAVVPPGVEMPERQAGADRRSDGAPYVLVLSRLAPSKRIDLIIRAFHQLAVRAPDVSWQLIVAGDGDPDMVHSLRQLAAGGDAASRIVFRGWVSGADKQSLLAGASLLAAPSHQESFGLSLVEAMSAGVPVLTSPDIDLAAAIEEARAGWVVEAEPDAIARALAEIASAPENLRDRGAAARQFARAYSWPTSISRLQGLYGQVLDHHPAAVAGVVTS